MKKAGYYTFGRLGRYKTVYSLMLGGIICVLCVNA